MYPSNNPGEGKQQSEIEQLNVQGNERTEISITNWEKCDQFLADIPQEIKEDVSAILDTYGDLDHSTLLATVYEKYPTYAKKSKLKRPRKSKKTNAPDSSNNS